MLSEMSGLEEVHDVVVVAATNRPDILDPALLRPGRFDRQILVSTPDKDSRLQILKIHTKDMPLKDVVLEELAEKTNGYSGADLEALCREAAMVALRKSIDANKVTAKDFEKAVHDISPSVSDEMNASYNTVVKKKREQRMNDDTDYIR
jgi:transitional endoplasmic reticulum ATPase